MPDLFSKIKYQYNDFIFNRALFPLQTLFKYYYYSYLLRRNFVTVRIKKRNGIAFKIRCRNGVDRKVLFYVFFQKYHITNSGYLKKDKPLILDLGANIGCTIIDYKLKHPGAMIFGYEMDFDNYQLAKSNCSQFDNVFLFNKAVWTQKATIGYNKNSPTDAYTIKKNASRSTQITKIDCLRISDILKENNIKEIDFLKMDIEGAEKDILSQEDLCWLEAVHSFNIEFHNITENELDGYIELLRSKGFKTKKSLHHWSALEGIRENVGKERYREG